MKIDFVEYMFTLWFIDDQHELGMNQMEEDQRVVFSINWWLEKVRLIVNRSMKINYLQYKFSYQSLSDKRGSYVWVIMSM